MSDLPQNRVEPDPQRKPDGTFGAGNNANPGGRPRRVRELEAAVLEAETPERVKEVVNAMRTMALSGDPKAAPAAAKIYLHTLGINGRTQADFADLLKDAPPEVVRWLASLN